MWYARGWYCAWAPAASCPAPTARACSTQKSRVRPGCGPVYVCVSTQARVPICGGSSERPAFFRLRSVRDAASPPADSSRASDAVSSFTLPPGVVSTRPRGSWLTAAIRHASARVPATGG
eukprot:scaffold93783_cov63-Phaeocystis_antarctica.AAC.2